MIFYTVREGISKIIELLSSEKEYVKGVLSNVSVAAGKSVDGVVNVSDDKTRVLIDVKLTYDKSATAGASIEVYFSVDGTNFDTKPIVTYTPSFSAGASVRESFAVENVPKAVKVVIKNNDGTYSLTVDSLDVVLFK